MFTEHLIFFVCPVFLGKEQTDSRYEAHEEGPLCSIFVRHSSHICCVLTGHMFHVSYLFALIFV